MSSPTSTTRADLLSGVFRSSAGLVPLLLVGIVLMMIVPLPAILLDVFIATSVALSITLLLISIYLQRPLDLSAFPTILLFTTLLRLSLNVASTRLILMHGDQGTSAAGQVVRAFGEFIVGGNYLVGATVFILLAIINFVVITKGAGRVAEVSARFTLDGLPGKQMSIDADLASGSVTQEEAKARRANVEQEADFFGAMDGASKFVRGDAIAGLLITGINIVMGFVVGVAQQGMSAAEAASTYTILTVGDGLASQLPALLVSTASGVVVTRAASGQALGSALMQQIGTHSRALTTAAVVLVVMGILPGMPLVPFAAMGGLVFLAARSAQRKAAMPSGADESKTQQEPTEREQLENLLPVDLLELEVGFDLVALVDASKGGELVDRIAALRRNLATELGIIIPSIHIRDNLRLKSNAYRLLLSGNEIGGGELRINRFLAMDPTGTLQEIKGEEVKEPAFGLPARWITSSDREKAEGLGYTVVDPGTVTATHLTELLRSNAHDLIGRTEVQELVDILATREPKLVDELIPNLLPLGEAIKVLRNLLKEGISIRDLRTIFEALADNAGETKDSVELTERVRQRLARTLSSRFNHEGEVAALLLDPNVEESFRTHGPDAETAKNILGSLDTTAREYSGVATPPLLMCAPDVRRKVSDFLSTRVPGLSVLSYREVDPKLTIRNLGVVNG